MFITYQQTSEQSYLLDYGQDININTNKKVISHFKYLIKNKFEYIFNVVPSFNKLLIVYDINYKKNVFACFCLFLLCFVFLLTVKIESCTLQEQ